VNTDVYTGADGAIVLSAPEGPEGDAAKAVLSANDLTVVGRVQNVRVISCSTACANPLPG